MTQLMNQFYSQFFVYTSYIISANKKYCDILEKYLLSGII